MTTRQHSLDEQQMSFLQGRALDAAISTYEPYFASLAEKLLDMADAAKTNEQQWELFSLSREVKANQKSFTRCFDECLIEGFIQFKLGRLGGKTCTELEQSSSLSLLADDSLERTLAVGSLARRAETHHAEQLFGLNQRLSMLAGGKKIPEDGNPLGPYQFAEALASMLEPLKLSNHQITIFYRLYEPILNKALAKLYQEVNDYLKQQGILPNLRYCISNKQSSQLNKPANNPAEAQVDNPIAEQTKQKGASQAGLGGNASAGFAEQSQANSPASQGGGNACDTMPQGQGEYQQQMLQAIYDIQQQQQSLNGVSSQSAVAKAMAGAANADNSACGMFQQSLPVVSGQALQQQLQGLPVGNAEHDLQQANPEGIQALDMRQAAFNLRELIAESEQTLDANHDRVIDLVGMIFEFMLSDEALPDSVKAVLSYLHTPLLKMALANPKLFEQEEHSGRKLLNALAYAGQRWVSADGASQFKVFPKIKSIVRSVIMEEASDLEPTVTQLLEEFLEFSAKVAKKLDMLEQRAKAKAEGEEKIRLVKKRVYSEIKHRLGDKQWPAPVVVLLLHPWADYLIFVLLRFGKSSEQWRQGLKMIDDILWSVQDKQTDNDRLKQQQLIKRLQDVLQQAISQVAFDPHKTQNLIKLLADVQKKTMLHEPVPTMKPDEQQQVEEEVHLQDYLPKVETELTSEQVKMLQQLASVKFGSWLEFKEEQGIIRRSKIAWFNPKTEHYMLVDKAKHHVTMLSALTIADLLISQQAKIIVDDTRPFFERALEGVLGKMKSALGDKKALKPVSA